MKLKERYTTRELIMIKELLMININVLIKTNILLSSVAEYILALETSEIILNRTM